MLINKWLEIIKIYQFIEFHLLFQNSMNQHLFLYNCFQIVACNNDHYS